MRATLLITLGLALTITLICMAVVASSRTHVLPNENWDMGLMRCAGEPCFLEITPGKTTWVAAVAALGNDSKYAKVVLVPSENGNSVDSIFIEPLVEQPITVGEIVALYGTPSCVDIYRQSSTVELNYRLLHVLTQFTDNQIRPDAYVTFIVMENPSVYPTQCDSIDGYKRQAIRRFWQGFASEQYYLYAE